MTFEQGDITKLDRSGEFDAVIGRLVLLYVGDPVAAMRAFATYVKPGGLSLLPGVCSPQRALGTAGAPA